VELLLRNDDFLFNEVLLGLNLKLGLLVLDKLLNGFV